MKSIKRIISNLFKTNSLKNILNRDIIDSSTMKKSDKDLKDLIKEKSNINSNIDRNSLSDINKNVFENYNKRIY
jgi:hypothetical protein